MKIGQHIGFSGIAILVFACSVSSSPTATNSSAGGSSSTCESGSLRCACYGNNTCDQGLQCMSSVCVAIPNGGGTSAGGTSAMATSSIGGSTNAGGTATTGGAANLGGSGLGGTGTASGGTATGGTPAAGGTTGTGGSVFAGGASATGGGSAAGGGFARTGGTSSTGGAGVAGGLAVTGGTSSTGGAGVAGGLAVTGGTSSTGGAAIGGKAATGGTLATGGMPATGGAATGGMPATGGTPARPPGPCDIYAAANTPCVAAYSMVRALSSTYTGPLYQIRVGSSSTNTGTGGILEDIGMTADGYADTATQDGYCSGTVCTVATLYDQSGNGNDLIRGTAGPTGNGIHSGDDDYESSATRGAVKAGGHNVYSLYMNEYEGYRTALGVKGKGVPIGNTDQGIYELADGTHYGPACCWDFGNASPDPNTYVTENTLFFGTGFWGTGAGSGPWFMGDFEGGVWAGGSGASTNNNPSNPSMAVSFALGILHTTSGQYALRMADVQTATTDLTTAYSGASPKTWGNAGGIVLGVGSDNSNNSWGTFYEGAITAGAPSDTTDLAVMKNIQAVGYSK